MKLVSQRAVAMQKSMRNQTFNNGVKLLTDLLSMCFNRWNVVAANYNCPGH
jgi:hypothetical protein